MIMLHAVLARAVLCKFFKEEITEHSIYGSEVRANATVITTLVYPGQDAGYHACYCKPQILPTMFTPVSEEDCCA
jgi:hypothetical protein